MEGEDLRLLSKKLTPNDICAEFLALSVVEHSFSPNLGIRVELNTTGATISDTGRGMRLHPDSGDTMSHAERALTSCYPCLPSDPDTERTLLDMIWRDRGSLGPALANFACPSLTFVSRRRGEAWSQVYRYGVAQSAPFRIGPTDRKGTTISFETPGRIEPAAFKRLAADLSVRIPGLRISLSERAAV
ncbi:hypothetical protein WNZ15_03500 [Roseibium sp. AS2]|uniref:hypothetical protein n=1 Tax=Roseibium sp. AS2 TaxID=3135781 RepID=UPI00317C33B9